MGHQLTGRREAMTALQNLVDTAWDYARYTESLEQALLLLHGLHPCITTDDPETVAQAIFDTVLAQQKAQDRRIADLQRTIDYMLAQRPNIGVEQHAPC
jgi:predicted ATPase